MSASPDEDAAAAKIQAIQRGNTERAELADQKEAATKIQAIQRGNKERAEIASGTAATEEVDEKVEAAADADGDGSGTADAKNSEPEPVEEEEEEVVEESAEAEDEPEPEPEPEPEQEQEPEPEPEPEPEEEGAPSSQQDNGAEPPRVDHGAYVASHRERTDAHNATGKSRIKQRHLQAPSKELHKKSCLRRLQLPDNIPSTPVIVMIGDVASLEDDASNKIQDFYRDGIMRAAAAIDALVIDSGLASGISAISPRKEYADYCRNICQLGITPGGIEDPLSKYHTH